MVDLLGAYKVTPELKKRAVDLRAKVAQDALKQVKGAGGMTVCTTSIWDNIVPLCLQHSCGGISACNDLKNVPVCRHCNAFN